MAKRPDKWERGARGRQPEQDVSTTSVHDSHDTNGEARCRRCRRPLHSELAVAAGMGATCALRVIAGKPDRPKSTPFDGQLAIPLAEVGGRR